MKFTTNKEHRDFFQKCGWIEFEGLVSSAQITSLDHSIRESLAQRLDIPVAGLAKCRQEKIYLQGRDLWRENLIIRKFALQVRYAEIASELIDKKSLRLGYDQFFPSKNEIVFPQENSMNFLRGPHLHSLQEMSCVSEVRCAWIVALSSAKTTCNESSSPHFFPQKEGNMVFLDAHVPIPWHLLSSVDQRLYMVVYTASHSHYRLQPLDPHTHFLKRLGYIFNDKLSDTLHPIILR